MTVNTDSTRELDIDRIVMLAIQTAGVLPAGAPRSGQQWNNLSAQARDFLELNVDHMQTLGSFARSVALYDVATVDGTASYVLPATTLGVVGDAQFLTDDSEASTFVKLITRGEYQNISDKTTSGRPTMYYPEMGAEITLYLWPVPSYNGTLTIQRNRLLADNDDGSKTLDLERYWNKYVMYDLAHSVALANQMPPARCGYIRTQAEKTLESCKRQATQPGDIRMVVNHRTGWRR